MLFVTYVYMFCFLDHDSFYDGPATMYLTFDLMLSNMKFIDRRSNYLSPFALHIGCVSAFLIIFATSIEDLTLPTIYFCWVVWVFWPRLLTSLCIIYFHCVLWFLRFLWSWIGLVMFKLKHLRCNHDPCLSWSHQSVTTHSAVIDYSRPMFPFSYNYLYIIEHVYLSCL